MTKNLLALPQLVDKRNDLPRFPRAVKKRSRSVKDLERGIHHSATLSTLAGSTPEGFANYHVNHLDWPTIGYDVVITPSRIIDTPKGPRAEIAWCLNPGEMGYHVGNSNGISFGICIAGDYRKEYISDAVAASYAELFEALDKDEIATGRVRGHNEYPGWGSTECPVFKPDWVLNRGKQLINKSTAKPTPAPVEPEKVEVQDRPDFVAIQQGDNMWQISQRFGVDYKKLVKLNSHLIPDRIPVGALIRLNEEAIFEEDYAGAWQTDEGISYRQERGVFENTSGVSIAVRFDGPELKNKVQFRLQPGETITYDRVYHHDGHVWISHVYNSTRRFTPIREIRDDKLGNAWGNTRLLK